jgi:hypothetical protein
LSGGMAQRRRRMTGSASHATSQAISPKIVTPREPRAEWVERREKVEEGEDEGRREEDDGALEGGLFNCNFINIKIINDDTHPSFSPDHLDTLEDISADMFDLITYKLNQSPALHFKLSQLILVISVVWMGGLLVKKKVCNLPEVQKVVEPGNQVPRKYIGLQKVLGPQKRNHHCNQVCRRILLYL